MKALELHSTWKRFDTAGWRRTLGTGYVVVLCYALVRQLTHQGFSLAGAGPFPPYTAGLAVGHGAKPLAPPTIWIAGHQPGQNPIVSYSPYSPAFSVPLLSLTYP